MAVRHLLAAAGRCVRVCLFGTSDGMGGTVPSGDESGCVMVALGYGWDAADSGMVFPFRRWVRGAVA
jgi:hypothetical protein